MTRREIFIHIETEDDTLNFANLLPLFTTAVEGASKTKIDITERIDSNDLEIQAALEKVRTLSQRELKEVVEQMIKAGILKPNYAQSAVSRAFWYIAEEGDRGSVIFSTDMVKTIIESPTLEQFKEKCEILGASVYHKLGETIYLKFRRIVFYALTNKDLETGD